MEPVRWMQRRRQYLENPYFSDAAKWVNQYDTRFNVIGKTEYFVNECHARSRIISRSTQL
jgi:hypothetical protein